VWLCDGCGYLYVSVQIDGPLHRDVDVEERLRELSAVTEAAVSFVEVYDRFGPHVAPYGRGPKEHVADAYTVLRDEVEKAKT